MLKKNFFLQRSVSYTDIVVSIRVLSTIAAITKAIETGSAILTYQALSCPEAHVMVLQIFSRYY